MQIRLNRLKHIGTYQVYVNKRLRNGMMVDSYLDQFSFPYGIYQPSYQDMLTAQGNNLTVADVTILVRHNDKFDVTHNTYVVKLEDGKSYKAISYAPSDSLNGFDRISLKKATS